MKTDKETASRIAKILAKELACRGLQLPHTQCLEVAAKLLGTKNLHTLQAKLDKGNTEPDDPVDRWIKKTCEKYPHDHLVPNKVFLHQFLVSVLSDEENYDASLEQIACDINDGPNIGDCEKLGSKQLRLQEIPEILLEIGNNGEFFGDPVACSQAGEVYLTNATGEDTGHILADELENLGIPYDKENDFPLTKEEAAQLQEVTELCGQAFLGNYTTLLGTQKFHCPTAELPYKDEFWKESDELALGDASVFPTEAEVRQTAKKLKDQLRHYAASRNGEILIEDDMPGRICVRLRLPFPKNQTEERKVGKESNQQDNPENRKCPICGAGEANQLMDCGGAGISQWRYICTACKDRSESTNN